MVVKLSSKQWENIRIILESKKQTIQEIADKYHIRRESIYSKAKYHNWNILTRKPRSKKNTKKKWFGVF